MQRHFKLTKSLGLLTLLAVIIAPLLIVSPAMADTPTTHTLTLLSGDTTQAAGYTDNNPYNSGGEILVSGSSTQTAGVTHTNPSAAPLNPASYGGSWVGASIIADPVGSWATIGGASWVSTTTLNSGVENPVEADGWRLFRGTFNITDIGSVTAANIQIAADNAYEFYLNGTLVASTALWSPPCTVYGPSPEPEDDETPFQTVKTYPLTVQSGTNTLMVVVRNWDNLGSGNPSGLVYKITVLHGVSHQQLDPAVYSGAGTWFHAPAVTDPASEWIQIPTGAHWVSTTADYSGTDNDYNGDSWRLFRDQFTIPSGATINSASIQIAGDNAFEIYLNGSLIATTADFSPTATVYGDSPEPGGTMIPFENTVTYTFTPQAGANTLMFVVRNWANDSSNPTGLLYTAVISYQGDSGGGSKGGSGGGSGSVTTVGGTVNKVDKLQLLLPWFGAGFGALLMLAIAINRLFFRKKQPISNR